MKRKIDLTIINGLFHGTLFIDGRLHAQASVRHDATGFHPRIVWKNRSHQQERFNTLKEAYVWTASCLSGL